MPPIFHALPLLNISAPSPPGAPTLPPLDRCSSAPGPLPPSGLRCQWADGGLSITGAAFSLGVDFVSVMLHRTDYSYGGVDVHYATAVRLDGQWSATVPLPAGASLELVVGVRGHRRGCAEDGGNGTWSTIVELNSTSCGAAPVEAEREPSHADSRPLGGVRGGATHWLEVFRVSELGRSLPDYLDNHDSGDLGGGGMITSVWAPGLAIDTTPITRYCVEVLNTTVTSTQTTTQGAASVPSAYADYRSTNPAYLVYSYPAWALYAEFTKGTEYASWCDLFEDRNIGQLAADHLSCCELDPSLPTFQMCDCCDRPSAAASRTFTGMTPIGLPVYAFPVDAVGHYPVQLPPIGRWYSHPVGGRCPLGARVGDGGCTWQRAPLSHSLSLRELVSLGLNLSTAGANVTNLQPAAQTVQNVAVFKEAWRRAGLAPCGQSPEHKYSRKRA